ncbi:uncharacterized protein LOC100206794 isoform X5 [Hydra vulgaris]|uniref:Uncharacterized protein LOC100206794 isoform X3 n=2 Tax=Hydra vulgaris TaxID=6087 RepID=A0ABM4BK65_HYDVU
MTKMNRNIDDQPIYHKFQDEESLKTSMSINSMKLLNAGISSQEHFHMIFKDLNVTLNGKNILHNVSGEILPGEVLAIMGPSGAGKSTLLNLLVGRKTKGIFLNNGSIEINGKSASKLLRRKIGYVMQEDIFFGHLTVRQSLEFIGKIRLPEDMKWSQKKALVDIVIENLGLSKCENTEMGGGLFARGCSGGEKKRCSIGVELISNPACIVMDEPTTGLDSSSALSLINTLKVLAKQQNRAICMTIHQPSSQVFHMFDKLLLLCNGKVAFYGKTSEVLLFFESIGMPSHLNWNPADFLMEQLSTDKDLQNKVVQSFENYKRENLKKDEKSYSKPEVEDHPDSYINFVAEINEDTDHNKKTIDGNKDLKNLDQSLSSKKWPSGFCTQVTALCQRSFIEAKSEIWDKLSFIQVIFVAIIAGLVWFNTPYSEASISDRQGVIFFALMYIFMRQMMHSIMTFPAEKKVIAKERSSGMYRLSAYFTAKNIVDLPIMLIPQVILYTTIYWSAGLNRSPVFLLGIFTVILTTALSQSVGLVIGGSIKDFKKTLVVAVIFNLSNLLLGGFYNKRLPPWLIWSKYISTYTYIYNIFLRIEFEYAKEEFKCSAISEFRECRNNNRTHITGPELMAYLKPIDLDIMQSVFVIVGLSIVLRMLFYFVLKYLNKAK